MNLRALSCPVTLLGTTRDILTDGDAVMEAARSIPGSRGRLLEGTHFLPFEQPQLVLSELRLLALLAGLTPVGEMPADPPPPLDPASASA